MLRWALQDPSAARLSAKLPGGKAATRNGPRRCPEPSINPQLVTSVDDRHCGGQAHIASAGSLLRGDVKHTCRAMAKNW
jgi:hypothetical protein